MFASRISKFFIVLLVFVAALATVSFAVRSANAPTVDRSYDAIEQMHALRFISSSYDLVEQIRVKRSSMDVKNVAIREYQLGERYGELPQDVASEKAARKYWLGERYGQLPNTDHSYEMIEALRLER